MITGATRYKFSVEEYECMEKAGVFAAGQRVELIEGEVVEKAPIGNRHFGAVNRLNRLLSRLVADRAIVSVQMPVIVSSGSEPEPDVALIPFSEEFLGVRKPRAEDVLLLIEVADTSLTLVRGTKLPLYAAAGIREFWLVDLTSDVIEVYRKPVGGTYAESTKAARGASISPEAFADIALAVDEVVGPVARAT